LTVLVAVQVFDTGSYCPPVFVSKSEVAPPQTIIFDPLHTAAWL
jgi:hypothetical protein